MVRSRPQIQRTGRPRLAGRAAVLGLNPNHYARDRALGRVRPTRAQRRLATESQRPLSELAHFVEFAHALLPHLEPHFAAGTDPGNLVRHARKRFSEPTTLVDTLSAS